MSTSLYPDESIWSDDDDDSPAQDSYLLSSQGYISLSNVPQKQQSRRHIAQASWVMEEKLQRSTSYANYPKHFNSKKSKHSQFNPQSKLNRLSQYRPKINKTDSISLFPKIDLAIWYLPMYILRNRSNKYKKHYIILSICILAVLFSISAQCFMIVSWLDPESELHNTARGIFYFIISQSLH